MLDGRWRLLFGLAWAAAAVYLFVRGQHPIVMPAVASLLAVWNVVRWYQTRQRPAAARLPLQRQEPAGGYEYNPELDFQKMDRDEEKTERG